jgi:hypothetical protein
MSLFIWLRNRRRGLAGHRDATHGSPRPQTAFRPRLEGLEGRDVPAQVNLTVSSLADSGPGTLRAAILTADAGSPSDKFTIGFGVTGTIDLQSPLPDLNNAIAIQGTGAGSLTVEQAAGTSFTSAIVTVDAGRTASLAGLTIANGSAGGIASNGTLTVTACTVSGNSAFVGGGILNNSGGGLAVLGCLITGNTGVFGGGVCNFGTVTVSNNSILSGNSASFEGGGVYNFSTLTVSGSTISGNSATGLNSTGGGIFNYELATLKVSNHSILSGNSAQEGGGLLNIGTATVRDSALIGNSATAGGGIYNFLDGKLDVVGSTLSGNSAVEGGGIYNDALGLLGGTLDVRSSTLTGNSAVDSGGGIYNAGTATLQECTLSGNSAGSAGGGIFNGTSGTLTLKDSNVTGNPAPSGADLFTLGAVTLDDSTVGVIGP